MAEAKKRLFNKARWRRVNSYLQLQFGTFDAAEEERAADNFSKWLIGFVWERIGEDCLLNSFNPCVSCKFVYYLNSSRSPASIFNHPAAAASL